VTVKVDVFDSLAGSWLTVVNYRNLTQTHRRLDQHASLGGLADPRPSCSFRGRPLLLLSRCIALLIFFEVYLPRVRQRRQLVAGGYPVVSTVMIGSCATSADLRHTWNATPPKAPFCFLALVIYAYPSRTSPVAH
jgi:hypothetical protein